MADLLREAPLGQLIRYVTKNKFLKYPEELPNFELPETYRVVLNSTGGKSRSRDSSSDEDIEKKDPPSPASPALRQQVTTHSLREDDPEDNAVSLSRTKSRADTIPYTEDRLQVDQDLAIQKTKTIPIEPVKTAEGNILVDWYTTDDPANPQNWSLGKKNFVALILSLYTFAVYSGSAIYTPGQLGVEERFGVSPTASSLPLSLYVLAYGLGPLIFSPMSEVPLIGRNPVYVTTFLIFLILSFPTAVVNNFAGLLVLRFLQGFFGSPCLATGGATMQDMYSLLYLPYAITIWASAAYCGPALGPLLSGFAVMAKGWRWSLWEITWISGPVFVLMFLLMPETSTPNLLLRRAGRLRKLTGDSHLKSQSEIDQAGMQPRRIAIDAIVKPMEITIKDPAILFVNIYTAIIYGIYYSFFEAFPLVYPVYYGFSIGIIGVLFLCILVSCFVGVIMYCAYLYWYLVPDILSHGFRSQEHRLVPALFASFGPVIGLFIFAWTARPDLPWIASVIGISTFGATVFIVIQCIFVYVPLSYPQYAASLFAGNDFFRSALACGSILFARPLFINLGIDKGVTLLAGLSVLGVIGIFILYFHGAQLRARSKFAVS